MAEGDVKVTGWIPMTDPFAVASLGKCGEELSELSGRVFRTIIQGIDEIDPATGRTNRKELVREIADVKASIQHIEEVLSLEIDIDRTIQKRNGYRQWMELIASHREQP